MSDTLQSVFDLPDVSFIDNDTAQDILNRLIKNYEDKITELTGEKKSLAPADPVRVLLNAVALELFQIEAYVDRAGKQDLLKYSYGEYLDNLAAGRGVTRSQAAAASVTLRFALSEAKSYAVGIPAQTRATNGAGLYFATAEYAEVAAGSTYADVKAECTETGIKGNGLVPGQLNVLADPVSYVASVSNTDTSSGGAELETDEHLAERVFLVPSSYSVAGPADAYIYWAKTYNSDIGSVKPISSEPCEVTVYILMADGTMPTAGVISGLQDYLSDSSIRPLTDQVTVSAPTAENFAVSITYYINRSDSSAASTIQSEVAAAVSDYIKWQTTEIGRDINPSELTKRVLAAGAKRVTVTYPAYTAVTGTKVAQCTGSTVTYGGLEDD